MSFPERLREAFRDASNTEIARRLKKSDAAVSNYMSGRVPPWPTMIEISAETGCSIHWLITGEGPKLVDEGRAAATRPPDQAGVEENKFFSQRERRAICRLAAESRVAPDEKVREIVLVALLTRGLVTLNEITGPPHSDDGPASGAKKTTSARKGRT